MFFSAQSTVRCVSVSKNHHRRDTGGVQRGAEIFFPERLIRRCTMKSISLSTNFAIFILFFGIATLEAFQNHHWLRAAFWLAVAVVFVCADNLRREDRGMVR